jgi:hypothetical protein
LGFFALAVLLPYKLDWAPLGFGALWTVVLLALAQHLRRVAQQVEAEMPSDARPTKPDK